MVIGAAAADDFVWPFHRTAVLQADGDALNSIQRYVATGSYRVVNLLLTKVFSLELLDLDGPSTFNGY